MDSHFEDNGEELNKTQKKRYENFQDKYGNGDLEKDTKDEINLIFLNGKKGENLVRLSIYKKIDFLDYI